MINHYIEAGKTLIPLQMVSKSPLIRWKDLTYNPKVLEDYREQTSRFGWLLTASDLVIDIDPRNGGSESFEALLSDFGLDLSGFIAVKTQSGGLHIYTSKPEDIAIKQHLPKYKGIDFKTSGGFVVCCGSPATSPELQPYTLAGGDLTQLKNIQPAPAKLLELLQVIESAPQFIQLDKFTRPEAVRLLKKISADLDYPDWIKVGLILFESFGEVEGFEIFDSWSKTSEQKYDQRKTKSTFQALAKHSQSYQGNKVRPSRLYKLAGELQQKTIDDEIEKIIFHLENCTDKNEFKQSIIPAFAHLVSEVGGQIDSTTKEDVKAKIAKTYKKLYPEIKAKEVQKLIKEAMQKAEPAIFFINPNNPEMNSGNWYKFVVFNESSKNYYRLDNDETHSAEGLKIKFTQDLRSSEPETKFDLIKNIQEKGLIKVVAGKMFKPDTAEKIIELNNKSYINTYRPLIVKPITENKAGFNEYLKVLKAHMTYITQGDEEASILWNWILFNVQHTGTKLKWALFLWGVQGVGKSFLSDLLAVLIGRQNVRSVSPAVSMNPQWNTWATDTAIVFLEEFETKGKNNENLSNFYKQMITADILDISEKFQAVRYQENVTNFIAISNNPDAVDVSDGDRRWCVLYSSISKIEELEERTGKRNYEYFNYLFEGLKTYSDDLYWHFRKEMIDPEFYEYKRAPMTKTKAILQENNNFYKDIDLSILETICNENDFIKFNSNFCLINEIFIEYKKQIDGINSYADDIPPRVKATALNRLGFKKFNKSFKSNNKEYRFFYCRPSYLSALSKNFNQFTTAYKANPFTKLNEIQNETK